MRIKTETMKVVRPPRPTGRPKIKAVSKILMAPKPSGPPRKKRPMSPGELKARTGKTVMADGGTVDKMKKKVRDTFKKLKLTGPAGQKKKLQDMLKKKKKDKIKDKVKQKLKEKKKSKPTKTGLLSKAGIAPVSAPGGIPKVQSQKTAQKDPPKKDNPQSEWIGQTLNLSRCLCRCLVQSLVLLNLCRCLDQKDQIGRSLDQFQCLDLVQNSSKGLWTICLKG